MAQEPTPAIVTALVHIPKFYNPDQYGRRRKVGAIKFKRTCFEITERFGGCILHEDPKRGFWGDKGVVFEDDIVVIDVDIPDTSEDRDWLIDYA